MMYTLKGKSKMLNIHRIMYSVIIGVALIVIMSVSALAVNENSPVAYMPNLPVWDGTVAERYAGGDGTRDNPYLISDGSELALLMKEINDTVRESQQTTAGEYYKLTNDILLNDVSDFYNWDSAENAPKNNWTPGGAVINYTIKGFAGYFDGNHYEIIGMYVNKPDRYNGLFGYVYNGQIKNLGIKYAYVNGGSNTSALTGYIRASTANAYISGCTVSDSVVRGKNCVGTLGGYIEAYTKKVFFDKCTSHAQVSGDNYVGGIGGLVAAYGVDYENNDNYAVRFTNCVNNGAVNGKKGIGGIMGSSKDMVASFSKNKKLAMLFENCINNGLIVSQGAEKGGIAGLVGPDGREDTGVLTNFKSCFVNLTCSDCIYGISLSPTDTTNSAVYTPDQMNDDKNFNNFNFDSIWGSISGNGSPAIRVRGDALGDGKLTAKDIIETLKIFIGKKDISEVELVNIDFNADEKYTLEDVNRFMEYLRNKGASNSSSK